MAGRKHGEMAKETPKATEPKKEMPTADTEAVERYMGAVIYQQQMGETV